MCEQLIIWKKQLK